MSSAALCSRARILRAFGVVGVVSAVLAASLSLSQPAQASGYPSTPTSVRATSTSGSSITATAARSTNATKYTLYVSTVRSDVYVANIRAGVKSSARRSASASSPKITITGLTYTSAPFYYRFEAANGSLRAFNVGIPSVGLLPPVPTLLRATSSTKGLYLNWASPAVTGFVVAQATNPAMTLNRRNYTIRDASHWFTPYGLAVGTTYYFQVRAMNTNTVSRWGSQVFAAAQMRAQSVKLMTYNMLNWLADGTQETGGIVPPWSERRVAAAALIKSVGPDVIAIQEGNQTTSTGYRQVDSLRDALASAGIDYTVAYVPPYARNHIMYRPDVYRPVGSGGQWQIGDGHTGAYQELENITSGARFLFVSAHTVPGNTRDLDLVREAETESLITQATAMAAAQNVPLVFGGDFNSSPVTSLHPIDGPAIAMRHHHMADARLVAQSHVNEQYQSFNGYIRTPHVYTIDIDYIWVSPGVSASSWGMAMRLSNGSFVGTIPSDHNPVYSQVQYPY